MNKPPLQLFGPAEKPSSGSKHSPGPPSGPASEQDIAFRQQFIHCENNIKVLSCFHGFVGLCLLVPGVLLYYRNAGSPDSRGDTSFSAAMFIGIGALALFLSVGLYRLRPWARIVGMVLAGFGVFASAIKCAAGTVSFVMLFSDNLAMRRDRGAGGIMLLWLVMTAINALISWGIFSLLKSHDAQTVCSAAYARVVALTKPEKKAGGWEFWAISILSIALVGIIWFLTRLPSE